MILDLPQDVLRLILFTTPPEEIEKITFVNKKLHAEVTRAEYWREACMHRYYSNNQIIKPQDESWKEHALILEKAIKWTSYHSSLQTSNKGYTITNVGSNNTSGAPNLFLAVGNRPLVAGPFTERYFEVVIDCLPEGADETKVIIGVAPFNLLDNPTWDKGKTNYGQSFGKEFGVGDRIGVLIHTEYMTVSFLKNDVLQGTPFVRLDKNIPWHPVVGLLYKGVQVTIPLPPLREPPQMPLR